MRLTPHQRRAVILKAAVQIASDHGLRSVNHGDVAKRCMVQTSTKTVRHYFVNREALWLAVIGEFPEMATQGRDLGLTC